MSKFRSKKADKVKAGKSFHYDYIVKRDSAGWQIILRWKGNVVDTLRCATAGELNRRRQGLSDDGILGYVAGGLDGGLNQ